MAEKKKKGENNQSDEDRDFGLPRVEITPIKSLETKQLEESGPKKPEVVSTEPLGGSPENKPVDAAEKSQAESKKNYWGLLVILLVLILGGYLIWEYVPNVGVDKNASESLMLKETPDKETTPPTNVGPDPVVKEIPVPEKFILTEISSKADSPRYFVIVGSFIDDDLARDFSEKLNKMNKNTYIIHPVGNNSFYRLAVAQFENLEQSIAEINRIQTDFEETLWVLKY